MRRPAEFFIYTDAMEVELKLSLAPADNEVLMRHPLIAAHATGPARAQHMTARYFDTPDLHFLHHGAGLRVRKVGEEWIQTMKAGGSVQSGLHSRNEWECPCLLYTSPSPRDRQKSRMPSSA